MVNQLSRIFSHNKKILGILGLLIAICLVTGIGAPDSFLTAQNTENTVRWTAIYGIISIGAAFVIMTGGIDLSIGSVLGLVGCLFAMSVATRYTPQDLVRVVKADAESRQLMLDSGTERYRVGDAISFLDRSYTIEKMDQDSITVAEPIATGANVGGVRRIHRGGKLGPVGEQEVRFGGLLRSVREIEIPGELNGVQAGDQVQFLYERGLDPTFTVHRVEPKGEKTIVEFLVNSGANVRPAEEVAFSHRHQRMPTSLAILFALAFSIGLGWIHGMLITKIPLQPFVVTLCGLLIYRGMTRYMTLDQEQGFGNEFLGLKEVAIGKLMRLVTGSEYELDIPMPFVYMAVIAVIASIVLNRTIFGRYVLALGNNEQAAKFSGINTDRTKILAYMVSAFCAGVAAILFALDVNSVQPAGHGASYELYAIAAAVLGGCSLRGGEGTIVGVVIAAAVIRVLNNAINLLGISTTLQDGIIGVVILVGVITDEVVRRVAANRRRAAEARRALEASSGS